uniref:Uncharacterized protein n=1 Tax=Lutzomyia longipalpis TaxID=7200 RepID=A0A1B0CNU4_LUTLO
MISRFVTLKVFAEHLIHFWERKIYLMREISSSRVSPSIQEAPSSQSKSPEPGKVDGAGRDSPNTAASTAKSSRRDSLSEKIVHHDLHALPNQPQHPPNASTALPARVVTPPQVTEIVKKTQCISSRWWRGAIEKFQRQKLNREQGGVNNNGDSTKSTNSQQNGQESGGGMKVPNQLESHQNGNGVPSQDSEDIR